MFSVARTLTVFRRPQCDRNIVLRDGEQPVCNNPALAAIAKSFICAAADVRLSPLTDFTPGPCDALSVGVRVSGRTALLAGDREVANETVDCDPTGSFTRCD